MGRAVVEAQTLDPAPRQTAVHLIRAAGQRAGPKGSDGKPPGLAERLHEYAIRRHHRKDLLQRPVDRGKDLRVVQHARRPRLRDQTTPRVQAASQQLIEPQRIELVRRAALHRVRQVQDQHVEAVRAALHEPAGIVVVQLQPRVIKRPLVVRRQVLAAQLDHLPVQVHHGHALHRIVAKHLAGRGALAAAGDAHSLGPRMVDHRRVDQSLVVHELVRLGRLRLAIQDQATTKAARLEHLHPLVTAPPVVDDPRYPRAEPQVGRDSLVVPVASIGFVAIRQHVRPRSPVLFALRPLPARPATTPEPSGSPLGACQRSALRLRGDRSPRRR